MSERGAEGQLARRQAELDAAREGGRSEGRAEPRAVRATAPRPARVPVSDTGYWSFIMLAVFLLFVFYIAGKGELTQWLQIMVPNPPNAPTSQGAGQQPAPGGSTGSATPGPTTQAAQPPGSAGPGITGIVGQPGSPATPQSPYAAGGATSGNVVTPGWSGFIKYWTGIFTNP